jgi:hypothetical protein
MTVPTARPSTPSGLSQAYETKATDHALQKYDNFTRYGHRLEVLWVGHKRQLTRYLFMFNNPVAIGWPPLSYLLSWSAAEGD